MAEKGISAKQDQYLSAIELQEAGVDYNKIADAIENKTLTINDALDYSAAERTGKKVGANIKGLKNKLVAAGISLDSPFASLDNSNTILDIAKKWKTAKGTYPEGPWTNIRAIEASLNRAWLISDKEGKYVLTDLENRTKTTLGKEHGGRQKRKSLKIDVPEAKISLPLITSSIAKIPDPHVRAAVAVNAIIPFRPNEVASLTFDDYDPATGEISEWKRGTKTRNKIVVPEFVRALLNNQAALAEEELSSIYHIEGSNEPPEGRKTVSRDEFEKLKRNFKLFKDVNVNKMTAAVNAPGGLKEAFAPYEKQMKRKIRGVSDLRKIIPTILAKEMDLGGVVSKIMGHGDDADFSDIMGNLKQMTHTHYVGKIIGGEDTSLIALRGLENMYANTLNLPNINSLSVLMNLDIPALGVKHLPNGKLAIDENIKAIDVVPEGSTRDELNNMGNRSKVNLSAADFELVRENANANLKASIENSLLAATKSKEERLIIKKRIDELVKTSGFQDLDIDLNTDGTIKANNSVANIDYEDLADAAEKNEGFAKLLKRLNIKPAKVGLTAGAIIAKTTKGLSAILPGAGAFQIPETMEKVEEMGGTPMEQKIAAGTELAGPFGFSDVMGVVAPVAEKVLEAGIEAEDKTGEKASSLISKALTGGLPLPQLDLNFNRGGFITKKEGHNA